MDLVNLSRASRRSAKENPKSSLFDFVTFHKKGTRNVKSPKQDLNLKRRGRRRNEASDSDKEGDEETEKTLTPVNSRKRKGGVSNQVLYSPKSRKPNAADGSPMASRRKSGRVKRIELDYDYQTDDDNETEVRSPVSKPRQRNRARNPSPNHPSNSSSRNQEKAPSKAASSTSTEIESVSSSESSGDLSEGVEAAFMIEERTAEYNLLRNSELTKNMLLVPVELVENVAGFMEPEFGRSSSNRDYSGVDRTTGHDLTDNLSIGYVRIEAKTVKPPEVCMDAKTVFFVISGSITVKSAGGYYRPKSGVRNNCLYGKAMGPGACIVIPEQTVYTFENWGTEDVILSYCIAKP